MDKRIGYGLTYEEALKLVSDTINGVPNETVSHINISTDHHSTVWAEKRDDGWRVYVPQGTLAALTNRGDSEIE